MDFFLEVLEIRSDIKVTFIRPLRSHFNLATWRFISFNYNVPLDSQSEWLSKSARGTGNQKNKHQKPGCRANRGSN